MHLKFCKSFENRENEFCYYDGDDLPDNDLPPGWQKLVEFRYEQSVELCNQFYREFHNVSDPAKIHNSYIANGAQGQGDCFYFISMQEIARISLNLSCTANQSKERFGSQMLYGRKQCSTGRSSTENIFLDVR